MLRRWLAVFVLLTWLLPPPLWAAITEVAGAKASSGDLFQGTAPTLAFGGPIGISNLLTVCGVVGALATDGQPTVTVTDTRSNSYTVSYGPQGTWTVGPTFNYKTFIARAIAVDTATPTVTVTPNSFFSGNDTFSFDLDAFAGTALSSPTDGAATDGETIGTAPAITVTTTIANDVVVAVAGKNNSSGSVTWTDPAGWTVIGESGAGGNSVAHSCLFKVVSSAGAQTAIWTTNSVGASTWTTQGAAFKADVSGPKVLLKLKN